MRNGYKIFDADTHFHASAESLEPFLDPALRPMKAELGLREFKTGWAGEEMPEPYTHLYQLGEQGWLGRCASALPGRGRTATERAAPLSELPGLQVPHVRRVGLGRGGAHPRHGRGGC